MVRAVRTFLLASVLLLACGRSGLVDDADGGAPGRRQAPLFVFKSGPPCMTAGVEEDLRPAASDRLVVVLVQAQEECSGAGGDYLVGREGSTRHYFAGDHDCRFLPSGLRGDRSVRWGLVRGSQTAALFTVPTGWCITQLDGISQLSTDSRAPAWALYATEADARAAVTALGGQP
jgi:hypothetical protein